MEKEEKDEGTAEVKGHIHHLQIQGRWHLVPLSLNNIKLQPVMTKIYQKAPESKMKKLSEADMICDLLTRKGLIPRSRAEKRDVMFIQN